MEMLCSRTRDRRRRRSDRDGQEPAGRLEGRQRQTDRWSCDVRGEEDQVQLELERPANAEREVPPMRRRGMDSESREGDDVAVDLRDASIKGDGWIHVEVQLERELDRRTPVELLLGRQIVLVGDGIDEEVLAVVAARDLHVTVQANVQDGATGQRHLEFQARVDAGLKLENEKPNPDEDRRTDGKEGVEEILSGEPV